MMLQKMELTRANERKRHSRTEANGILPLNSAAKSSLPALVQNSVDASDHWFVSSPDDVTASAERTETSPTSHANLAQLLWPAERIDSLSKWRLPI